MRQLIREPWKKKEPGSRLSQRAAKEAAMSTIERAQMEEKARRFARCHFMSLGFKMPKKMASFMVYLKEELATEEIQARIDRAFEDLV